MENRLGESVRQEGYLESAVWVDATIFAFDLSPGMVAGSQRLDRRAGALHMKSVLIA
jgi:hypothetical protein